MLRKAPIVQGSELYYSPVPKRSSIFWVVWSCIAVLAIDGTRRRENTQHVIIIQRISSKNQHSLAEELVAQLIASTT